MNDLRAVNRVTSGDETAMNRLIDKYAKLIWSIAATILSGVGSVQDVEECVADTFIHLWAHPQQFDEKRGKLKTYLCIIARSKATDRYRKLSRQSAVPLDEAIMGTLDITDAMLTDDTKRALSAAVDSLEEPSREIVLRRYYYGQKPKAIAFALDMSVKQVENSLYRSKRNLRQLLTNKEGVRT